MATRILKLNPEYVDEVKRIEAELESYLSKGWDLVTAVGVSQPSAPNSTWVDGVQPGKGYVVFVLRSDMVTQAMLEKSDAEKRDK